MHGESQARALMAALIGEGVSPEAVGRAVRAARSARPGMQIGLLAGDVAPHELVRAFVSEQATLLFKRLPDPPDPAL